MNRQDTRQLADMAHQLVQIGMREPLDIYAYSKAPYYKFLYLLTATHNFKTCVELGSFLGVGALHLTSGDPRTKVYTIDRDPREWQVDVNAYQLPNIHRICDDTCGMEAGQSVPAAVDLLFIDADHTPDAVCRDYAFWRPRVQPGGVILFDDRKWEGNDSAWQQIIAGQEDNAIVLDDLHAPFGFGAILV